MPFGLTGMTLAVTLFFWSCTGFESMVIPTEEIKNPSKTIPWAMILGVSITVLIYVFLAIVFVGMVDLSSLKLGSWNQLNTISSPLAEIAASRGLIGLAIIATLGAIIATAGSAGSWVLLQGRMPYAMAEDRLFWLPMAKVHPKYGTPAKSIIFTSILTTLVLIAIPSFPSLALIASITAVVSYGAACLATLILRKTHPTEARPFRLPVIKIFSSLGFVLATFLIYWASWPWTLVTAILMMTGYPVYLLIGEKKSTPFRCLWIPVYLWGIVLISYLGDPLFVFNNFTPWAPIGLIKMPYDLVVLAFFALIIFYWGYKANTTEKYLPSRSVFDEK